MFVTQVALHDAPAADELRYPDGLTRYGVAVDDRHVYYTDSSAGMVLRVPLAGGEPTVLARDQELASEITVDGANVYWINSFAGGAVMKLAK